MRRRSRECAMQILYQLDLNQQLTDPTQLDSAIDDYWSSFDARMPVDKEFAERLARGVAHKLQSIDEAVASVSKKWKVQRMEKVDRNLIRVAAFEIFHCPDIPQNVSINEALEIAKRFSTSDAVPFINGILDGLKEEK